MFNLVELDGKTFRLTEVRREVGTYSCDNCAVYNKEEKSCPVPMSNVDCFKRTSDNGTEYVYKEAGY